MWHDQRHRLPLSVFKFISCVLVHVRAQAMLCVCVECKGQLTRGPFLSLRHEFWGETSILRLGTKCLFLLGRLLSPLCHFQKILLICHLIYWTYLTK